MAVAQKFPFKVATVFCNGGCDNVSCDYGCIGCGACVSACKFDAIHLNDKGVAEVNEDICIGCGACARQCPKKLISIRLKGNAFVPMCSNKDKGPSVKDVCAKSCIACGACVRKCPADAIELIDNHAVIHYDLCLNCGACSVACPRHVIIDRRGVLTPKR